MSFVYNLTIDEKDWTLKGVQSFYKVHKFDHYSIEAFIIGNDIM